MATIRQRSAGSWEIIIRRKGLLPKPHYASSETREEAEIYAAGIERLLDQGIVPAELIHTEEIRAQSVDEWAREYLHIVSISESDTILLNALLPVMSGWRTSALTIDWAQAWVTSMKRKDKLSPSSIRHKVGAVARLFDWCCRNNSLSSNPLRLLPGRYASYTPSDGEAKLDIERDRRLLPGEYERILWIIDGGVPGGQQRGIVQDNAQWRLMFVLAVESAMRLREMYTLSIDQVDLNKRTIFLDKTKNGDKRQVPLSSVAVSALSAWLASGEFVFNFWDGDPSSLRRTTLKLSRKWATIARLAGCDGLHFHDLRHEAVCRLYEKTNLSDLQIAKISGHKDLRMLSRYANLRGSDLAELMW
ncbi:MAG: site-specific integrase [Methylovulum sp.]|nr:site-specific integrase [Methylovulum sp.]